MSSTAYSLSQVDRHRLLYPILATKGTTLPEKDDKAACRPCYLEFDRITVSLKGQPFEITPFGHKVQDKPLGGQIHYLLLGIREEHDPAIRKDHKKERSLEEHRS